MHVQFSCETRKRLELANINDTIFKIFYTLDEKAEIWNKTRYMF